MWPFIPLHLRKSVSLRAGPFAARGMTNVVKTYRISSWRVHVYERTEQYEIPYQLFRNSMFQLWHYMLTNTTDTNYIDLHIGCRLLVKQPTVIPSHFLDIGSICTTMKFAVTDVSAWEIKAIRCIVIWLTLKHNHIKVQKVCTYLQSFAHADKIIVSLMQLKCKFRWYRWTTMDFWLTAWYMLPLSDLFVVLQTSGYEAI